jgi:D-alanyl-lipoteichoic acid acyltransferase DltB (MBOAT superfamily)
MFYPQLVAGPIERPQNMIHQFHEEHHFNFDNLFSGLRWMLWGLFKKVVIADRLAIMVDYIYNGNGQPSGTEWIIATFLFSIQIYCDFSGYSDMALGSARIMGFNLMLNFRQPYFSKNISEFWSRWHISLSTWFKDYLYIPLGGNRVKISRMYFNLFFLKGGKVTLEPIQQRGTCVSSRPATTRTTPPRLPRTRRRRPRPGRPS